MERSKRAIILSLVITLLLTIFPMNLVIGEDVSKDDNKIHIESTYPHNNQEWVEVNPMIQFKFKESIEIKDKTKIKISSDAGKFAVDLNKDAFVSFEGDTLKIDINSLDRGGKFNLREDTAYKVTLEAGAIKLKNKKDKNNKDILNDMENLYFITGREKGIANRGLFVENYSSNALATDQINVIQNTQLDSDGQVYIHFNKDIQWNKYTKNIKTDSDALKHFKLFKKPRAYQKNNDMSDKSYMYDILKLPVPSGNESVDIERVEILKDSLGKNTKILKVTPKNALLNLNEYQIALDDKDILVSFDDDLLKHDIRQNIWTKASNDKSIPLWDRDSSAEEIVEDLDVPNKDYKIDNYVIYGAPNYSKTKPIIIHVDKELRLRLYNEGDISPLSGVRLYENYKDGNNREDIGNYKIEYYLEDGVKKTKLLFYPQNELGSGKEYRLEIDGGTFVTRGNVGLKGIGLRFGVEGDRTKETGIYEANIIVDGNKMTNEIFDDYLYFKKNDKGEEDKLERKHTVGFELKGYNFSEEIEDIKLVKVADYNPEDEELKQAYEQGLVKELGDNANNGTYKDDKLNYPKTISISPRNVKFNSVNNITGTFDQETLAVLSKASSLGEYEVQITFSSESITRSKYMGTSKGSKGRFYNNVRTCKQAPKPIYRTPYENENNVNHESLSFIEISFEDTYGDIRNQLGGGIATTNKLIGFKVNPEGDASTDLIYDTNNIEVIRIGGSKRITFRIPIKTSELKEGTTYRVTIPEDIVRCKHDFPVHKNKEETWTFTTGSRSTAVKVYEGSVPEDYYADYPIIIEGTNLISATSVQFENVKTGTKYDAERIAFRLKNDHYEDRLYAYLPSRNKLPVGEYNIVINNSILQHTYKHSVFSVVEKGKYVPNEIYREKDTSIDGEKIEGSLKEIIKSSKNELLLDSKYTSKLLNLDLVVGEDVLTRDIKYDGSSLSLLNTESKWSNVKLTSIKKISLSDPMTIRLGRAEPQIRDVVKKKLRGENIKSDFIIVGGENYTAQKLSLSIPFKEINAKNLKVLRYDEETRRISEIKLLDRNINKIDKVVNIDLVSALPSDNVTKGIFVVVEN